MPDPDAEPRGATTLCDQDAVALRRLIGQGAVSPLEVLESCIARMGALNQALNAVVATDLERARREADAAGRAVTAREPLGPLHGLPVVVKDVHATKGLRTTWGSELFANHVPAADDRLVAALRRAGAIVLGKTNTPEFAAGAHTVNRVYGVTRNPFDPERSCGGSSGGSAVAVATGMAPLATGTDLGGSLRVPAAFCGVVGFRPSPGLVPSDRPEAALSSTDVDGPMARTVPDVALMLAALSGTTPPELPASDLRGLRVAVSDDLGRYPVEPGVRAAFRAAVAALEASGAVVEEAVPPLEDADRVFEVLRALAFVAVHGERLAAAPDKVGPNVADNVRQGQAMSLPDVADAMTRHVTLRQRFDAFMARYDMLVCPTSPVPPFPIDQPYVTAVDGRPLERYFHWLGLTYALSVTGCPVVALPCGRDPEGLPFGVQLCGRRGDDTGLLGLAAAVERVFRSQ